MAGVELVLVVHRSNRLLGSYEAMPLCRRHNYLGRYFDLDCMSIKRVIIYRDNNKRPKHDCGRMEIRGHQNHHTLL